MNPGEAKSTYVAYLLQSAEESIASAQSEHAQARYRFAMNRVYYACFYAACAVLVNEDHRFVKHEGVRSAVHKHLVKSGRIPATMGKFYDIVSKARQAADYGEFITFDADVVSSHIAEAEGFIVRMRELITRASGRCG